MVLQQNVQIHNPPVIESEARIFASASKRSYRVELGDLSVLSYMVDTHYYFCKTSENDKRQADDDYISY
jgi:hypothetical protein